MKYCANCNKEHADSYDKCSLCGLPLLQLTGSLKTHISTDGIDDLLGSYEDPEISSEVSPVENSAIIQTVTPGVEQSEEQPVKEKAKNDGATSKFISRLFSVSGAAFGAALLILVAVVLIFSVFSNNLFGGGNSTSGKSDSTVQTPLPPEPTVSPENDPIESPAGNEPVTLDSLVISETDSANYLKLCDDEAWVDAKSGGALSFYEDNTYLRSTLGGQEITRGQSAVSGNQLYMSNRFGELIAYGFYIEGSCLYIIDNTENSTTAYESSSTYSPDDEQTGDLFSYPVSDADAASYEELVALGPWTDAENGYSLIFDANNSYITDMGNDSRGGYGSALVSDGQLCMAKGSITDQVYSCTYTLSSGVLTISFDGNNYQLLSKSAYDALLLKNQLDDELYTLLVEGSYWASRDDMASYHLYFLADHTFELCIMDLSTGKEELMRSGSTTVSGDKLTFEFSDTKAEYTLSLMDNILHLTNLSGGHITTYESFRTFHY